MNKKLWIGIVVVAIVAVAIFSGCVEKEKASEATPIPVPTLTPTPRPPLNYDSSEVEEISVDVDVNDNYYPTVSLSFYDKYGRMITKFNNGETNIIVALEHFWKDPIWTDSTIVATGKKIPESISIYVVEDTKLEFEGTVIDLGGVKDDCRHIGVVVLLPGGRIANATMDFKYWEEINTKQYVKGYADGEADARRGYSTQVSSYDDKNYRDGYYDGYGGFTPVATSWLIGGHETITLSPPISGQPKSWHPVTTFSGKEDKNTTSFTIQGDIWRVKFTASSSTAPEYLSLYGHIYPKGKTVGGIGDVEYGKYDFISGGVCDETFYLLEGNGDYYIRIREANLDSWKVEVEDYY